MKIIKKEEREAKSALKKYLQLHADNTSEGLAKKKRVVVTDDLIDKLFTKLDSTVVTALKTEASGHISLDGKGATQVPEEMYLTYDALNKYK